MITENNTCNDYSSFIGEPGFQQPCHTPDDEQMLHLLSKPTTRKGTLTHKQIGEHNMDKTRSDGLWLQKNGCVYDVVSLHRQLSEMVAINKGRLPEVCDIGDIINGEDDDEDESISDIISTYDLMSAYIDPMESVSYNNIWKCLPSIDLTEEQIKQALGVAYVAHYKELSIEESQAEFHQEVFILRCDIQSQVLTPQISSLLDVLERSVLTQCIIPHGLDPNLAHFKLPRGVYNDDLRSWLQTWVPFDTDATEDLMARTPCFEIVLESEADKTFQESLRPYENENEFNHDIEGEAAWNVLEHHVIEMDICSPQQLERKRNHLTEKQIKNKRQKLANYFSRNYKRKTDCSIWAECMENGWKDFQVLCKDQQ